MNVSRKRVWEIDFVRGFAILLVVIDHAMFNFSRTYGFWAGAGSAFLQKLQAAGTDYWQSDVRAIWRPAFLFLFFFTSGICTIFSKNNFLRGMRLSIVACCISILTYSAGFFMAIRTFCLFGVLHCLGLVIIIFSLVEILLKVFLTLVAKIRKVSYNRKAERYLSTIVFLCLGIAFSVVNHFFNVPLLAFDRTGETILTNSKILGLFFFVDNWWTADYFPLFPYIAFFFLGAGAAGILYPKKQSLLPDLDGPWHKIISLPGHYAIYFYLGGQTLVLAICALLSAIILGRPF